MNKNNKDFDLFQKEFKRYQQYFGVTGYKVYFEYKPFEDDYAGISIDILNMTATIRLNSKLPKYQEDHKDIKRTARHEAIHLLCGELYELSKERHVGAGELYRVCEELVTRLEGVIPSLPEQ